MFAPEQQNPYISHFGYMLSAYNSAWHTGGMKQKLTEWMILQMR